MEQFYAQIKIQAGPDDVRTAILAQLTQLTRRQLQVLVNDYVWHNW